MDRENYISDLKLYRFSHNTIHSAGHTQSFDRPRIGYVLKGWADFLYQGKTYTAKEGDLIYIAVGTTYYSIWYGEPEIEFYSLDLRFASKSAFYQYRFAIVPNYPRELLDAIYKGGHLEAIGHTYLLLDDLFRRMTAEGQALENSPVFPAIQYIEENYMKKITIKTLADLCHMSQPRFFALFKEATGVSPIHYKHNICIQHALELLNTTKLSVDEISNATGFSTSNYFRSIFGKITGTTPLKVRKGK